MTTLLSPIVQVCDAISGARPGARREMVEAYIQRLRDLENLALEFPGVTKSFAIQAGRELRVMTTIQLSKDKQEDLPASAPRDEFVKGKTEWDKTLNLPKMIFPSLLVNMNAGRLPPADADGHRYFLIPMNTRQPTDELGRKEEKKEEEKKE